MLGLHLLGEQRGLDAVEEAFEPADELGLGDAKLGLRRGVALERQGELGELVAELWREALGQLLHRELVDLAQPDPACFVEGGLAHLLQQLTDHGADAHDLRRLGDALADHLLALLIRLRDDDEAGVILGLGGLV